MYLTKTHNNNGKEEPPSLIWVTHFQLQKGEVQSTMSIHTGLKIIVRKQHIYNKARVKLGHQRAIYCL